jgi:hypothetical protein
MYMRYMASVVRIMISSVEMPLHGKKEDGSEIMQTRYTQVVMNEDMIYSRQTLRCDGYEPQKLTDLGARPPIPRVVSLGG